MAEVPHQLHYSGFATDGAGDPLNCPNTFECATSFDLKFRIYSEGEGGAVYWEETHSAVSFYDGSFHVALGTVTPIDADLLSGDRWLGVAVNDNEEMLPRQKLLSAAYAIRAGTVENAENAAQLGGLSPADYASAESVTELQTIIDGSDDDTLAALGCATGQVAKASDGGWVCADASDSDTQLTEEQVDEMVANNGYAVGPHTVDTDTQLTEEQVDTMVANNGYAVGPHTVNTDTQLTEEQVDAMVANNGYAVGPHTVDTDTQLTEEQVDEMVCQQWLHYGPSHREHRYPAYRRAGGCDGCQQWLYYGSSHCRYRYPAHRRAGGYDGCQQWLHYGPSHCRYRYPAHRRAGGRYDCQQWLCTAGSDYRPRCKPGVTPNRDWSSDHYTYRFTGRIG